jgi:molybdopterin converting factor small subunit
VQVNLRVPSMLRDLTDGRAGLTIEVDDGTTIGHLLDAVGVTHPAFERRVRDEQGALRTHVNVFLADEDVRALDGLDTRLHAGDEVSVLAAISGG